MASDRPISWDGGPPEWRAVGRNVMYGPIICVTKLGARFLAWRIRLVGRADRA